VILIVTLIVISISILIVNLIVLLILRLILILIVLLIVIMIVILYVILTVILIIVIVIAMFILFSFDLVSVCGWRVFQKFTELEVRFCTAHTRRSSRCTYSEHNTLWSDSRFGMCFLN